MGWPATDRLPCFRRGSNVRRGSISHQSGLAHDSLLPRRPVLRACHVVVFNHPVLLLPKSHLQAFTSHLLYNNFHGEQRGSRDFQTSSSVGQCANSAVRGPTPCGHWASLHDAPPSFSLRLFTPYPSPPRARDIRLKRSSWKVCNEYGIKKCLPHVT
ncbi:BQ5605_C006g03857 [Microbotryum silenes-dioicae]|uniref:BQ5605_C006g03857 protein n=1 Tax=Microbotryum silenes-dioicae TaxID=796604 RepID=A0A2X0P1C4_9BASI|nr:BQ5605_C006g03857 [Microbotryum silenes-dioicae]